MMARKPAQPAKLAIETVSVDSLSLDPANLRRHPERNLETIKASLRRFSQQKPIVVGPNNVVVAGNGTLEAAKALGWTEIDIVRTSLSGSDAVAFAIADNRTAELAEWSDGLADVLAALAAEDEALRDAAGFDADELAAILRDQTGEWLDLESPPESVEENVERIEQIKKQRREGNDSTAGKNDTERYLVIVFPSRKARESAANSLGLPSDERYVAAESVRITTRTKLKASGKSAADSSKSGACG
jgi:ParB-like chromosome segregation protein Spo0J